MKVDRRELFSVGLTFAALAATEARAADGSTPGDGIPLWPRGPVDPVPDGLEQTEVERSIDPALQDRAVRGVKHPALTPFAADRPNGAAVIAVPGGGYERLAWDKEGLDIAKWFANRGVTGFALSYRLPRDGWEGGPDTPLADIQRAVRLIRANARQYSIDPERIAVVGFSAGGHLVANLAAQFDREVYPAQDAADRLSARPCLVAPIYPAIAIDQLAKAFPSGQSLFGKPLDAATTERHAPHLNARMDAPPHFLLHAEDDPLVGADHTLALRAALRAKNVPVETHLYAKGGHGFGIRNTKGLPLDEWPERLLAFGKTTGWIK